METRTCANEKTNLQMEIPDLSIDEMEPVIAPGTAINHNETVTTRLDLDVEELEPIIAPGVSANHNEAFQPS